MSQHPSTSQGDLSESQDSDALTLLLKTKNDRPKSCEAPQITSNVRAFTRSSSMTDIFSDLATNGPLPPTPARGSPAPQSSQGPSVPNGKPTSPFVERSNLMGPGGQTSAQTVSSKDPKAAAQAASDMRNVVRRKLTGYVGFANLPNQWHRKSVRKGFNFNVMVVGE